MKRRSTVLTAAIILATLIPFHRVAAGGMTGSSSWSITAILSPILTDYVLASGSLGESDTWGMQPVSQRLPERDTTLTLTNPTAPERFYLSQNSPNPFRDATSISYGLPAPTWVRISIHSMLGSEIMSVVDEPQKSGVYTVEFSEPDLQPGIYFYRIQTDYGVLTRRMTVR